LLELEEAGHLIDDKDVLIWYLLRKYCGDGAEVTPRELQAIYEHPSEFVIARYRDEDTGLLTLRAS
jgi:hypothetical protein